ncbi:crotonase/enoyl-CoA hydratase family protein [Aureimonas jatrophae]|uniref:Enoyl-CoA hydratase/carnithine racemase n=1 Tax=Aureimonas jatrophae TaxID=1166073 RepID=A0A1H0GMJ4_9HYPH|nr:crotonase/enoyl-CoA hydratase family protein [Aureimonas jatrophae]MBB3949651.1 enoyl-CoA hydratase/carnithine racemase [Aureimonas jatrophae]SDO08114.1 Enoyl-CoA hydratase/carnithine racemase [Aureimonas jatrophae]
MSGASPENIGVVQQGSVLTIRLQRPEKKNAIDRAMYAAMTRCLRAATADDTVRCVRFAGGPGSFSAGNDIADFLGVGEAGTLDEVQAFLDTVVDFPKPIVAAVDGIAIGIGTTLLFHCDQVVASPRSVFRTPFSDLGLVPEAGSSLLAPRLMGEREAFALLAMGETFDANRALRTGIVTQLADDVDGASLHVAEQLAGKPSEALAITRTLLRPDREQLRERIGVESRFFAECLRSPEARTAFAAFLR